MRRLRPALDRRVPSLLLLAAAVAGLVAGLLSALADGSPTPSPRTTSGVARAAAEVPLTTGPLRTAMPGVGDPGHDERLPVTFPERPGRDAGIVARAADPYGGPEWAVRTFSARSMQYSSVRPPRAVRQTCAQVGRILRGRFVWIAPHRPRAFGVPVNTTVTTVCTGRNRGVVLGALRLPAAADPGSNPQIAATVVWGISPRPGTRAALRSPEDTLELPALRGGTRLRVLRGDLDVGRRTAIADGKAVDGGVDNAEYGLPSFAGSPAKRRDPGDPFGATAGLRIAAIVTDPSADRPMLVATADAGGANGPPAARSGGPHSPRSTRCYVVVDRLVGGEPVRTVGTTGALAPSQALCQTAFRVPEGRWTSLGGSMSSNGSDHVAERRRLRELRTLAGSSSQAWAFPRDVTEVDVEDDLGVRTVRTVSLGDASILYVQRAGDLAATGFTFFGGEDRHVFTGRKADGTEVRLRYWHPR